MTEEAMIGLAEQLIEACYDPSNKAFRGKVMELQNVTSDGSDIGDWVVSITPVRFPDGKIRKFETEAN